MHAPHPAFCGELMRNERENICECSHQVRECAKRSHNENILRTFAGKGKINPTSINMETEKSKQKRFYNKRVSRSQRGLSNECCQIF